MAAEDWFFSLATNPVLSPEFMMDTSPLIVAQLEYVMINVPSASKLAPSLTFEPLVSHQDVASGFRDLRDSAGRDPNSVARWTPLVLVAQETNRSSC